MKFSIGELSRMLDDIGIHGSEQSRYFNGNTAAIGMLSYGRPVMDIAALDEYADANGGRDMSLEDWLREHSSYPLELWEFYLGIEGAKDNGI